MPTFLGRHECLFFVRRIVTFDGGQGERRKQGIDQPREGIQTSRTRRCASR
jgi:hypothetical protein